MRSSKSRSRGKSGRNRSAGNNINRVFESSGPEGKVRGTPQQVIDKYLQLTRDAQLSNDRVAAENFQQHAEHYARLLGEAQREAEAKRAEQEARRAEQEAQRRQQREEAEGQHEPRQEQSGAAETAEEDSGLVETPESKPKPRRSRKPRQPKGQGGNDGDTGSGTSPGASTPDAPEAAE